MGFNSGKIKVESTAKKKTKNSAWNGDAPKGWGIITDPAGQLKFPGQPTRIPGNTMSTRGYGNIPLMVYPDVGSPQMIPPNSGNHTFPGANYFDEYPIDMNLPDLSQPQGYGHGVINPNYVEGMYGRKFGRNDINFKMGTPTEKFDPNIGISFKRSFDIGGEIIELSEEEVEEYRAQGYKVKELPTYQGDINGSEVRRDNTTVNMGRIPDFSNPEFYTPPAPDPYDIPSVPSSVRKALMNKKPGTIKPTVKQPILSKLHDIVSNPLTALGNSRGGLADNIGASLDAGILERNPLDMAIDVLNPVAYANLARDTYRDVDAGNYGMAALNAASMIPGFGTAGKYAKQYKNFRRGLPGGVNNPLGPLTGGMSRKTQTNYFDFGRGKTVEDFDKFGNRTALYDRAGKKTFDPQVDMFGNPMSEERAALYNRFKSAYAEPKNISEAERIRRTKMVADLQLKDSNMSKELREIINERDALKYDESLLDDLKEAKLLGKDPSDIIKESTGLSLKQYNEVIKTTDKQLFDKVIGSPAKLKDMQYKGKALWSNPLGDKYRYETFNENLHEMLGADFYGMEYMTGANLKKKLKQQNPFRKLDYSKPLPLHSKDFLNTMIFRGDSYAQALAKKQYNKAVADRAKQAIQIAADKKTMSQAGRSKKGLADLLDVPFWMAKNKYGGVPLPMHQDVGETGQVKYGTPEYREAYEKGQIVREPVPGYLQKTLPEFQVVGGQEGEDFSYYNNLNAEQKKLLRDPSPIGRGIRSQATHGYGLDGNPSFTESVYDFAGAFPKSAAQSVGDAFAIPQALAVEEVERLRGNDYDYRNAIGNQLKEFGTEGYQQRVPSETLGFKQPEGFWENAANIGMDIVADPANLAGIGLAGKALKAERFLAKGLNKLKPNLKIPSALTNAAGTSNQMRNRLYENIGANMDFTPPATRTIDELRNTLNFRGLDIPETPTLNPLPENFLNDINFNDLVDEGPPPMPQNIEGPPTFNEPTPEMIAAIEQEFPNPVPENFFNPYEPRAVTRTAGEPYGELGMGQLQIGTTMPGSPLEKQLNKAGEINRNNLVNYLNKPDVPAADRAVIQDVLDNTFPDAKNINYVQLQEEVSKQLSPLERKLEPSGIYKDYGLNKLGYESRGAGTPTEIRDLEEQVAMWDADIATAQAPVDKINEEVDLIINAQSEMEYPDSEMAAHLDDLFRQLEMAEHGVTQIKDSRKAAQNRLDRMQKGVTSETVLFGSPEGIGPGSAKHWSDPDVLFHSRTFTDPEHPDVLYISESQSDWGQQKLAESLNTKDVKILEDNVSSFKEKIELYEGAKISDDGLYHFPERAQTMPMDQDALDLQIKLNKQFLDEDGTKLADLKKISGKADNPQRKALHKKHPERFFQENIALAAEKGQSTVRFPTSETAAKIQGYPKIHVETPELVKARELNNELATKIQKLESDKYKIANNPAEQANAGYNDKIANLEKKIDDLQPAFVKAETALQKIQANTPKDFSSRHKTILKKYEGIPKVSNKTLKIKPATVTDTKGNTWYEIPVPEDYKTGKGKIKAFSVGGGIGAGMTMGDYDMPEYGTGGAILDKYKTTGEVDGDRPVSIQTLPEFQSISSKRTGETGGINLDPHTQKMWDINDLQRKLSDEETRVQGIRNNIVTEADRIAGSKHPEQAFSPSMQNWLETTDQATWACNTYACQVMRNAGATTTQDTMYRKKPLPAGSKMPLIPGNLQFNRMSQDLGFELLPKGAMPDQPGDLIRGKFSMADADPQHSVISSGNFDSDVGGYTGFDSDGDYKNFNYRQGNEYYMRPKDFGPNNEEVNRVMRYVGNVPQMQQGIKTAEGELRNIPVERTVPKPTPQIANAHNPQLNTTERDGAKIMSNKEIRQSIKQQKMANKQAPPGYHVMPDGTLMANANMNYGAGGQPYYEYGGHINNYDMGGSTAPMNSNIDTEGSKRIGATVNLIGQNIATNEMRKQKEALLQQQQQIQQMMAANNFAYGGSNIGEEFNPNTALRNQYQGVVTKSKFDTRNAFNDVIGAGMQVAQQKDVNRQHANYTQERQKLNTDVNAGMYDPVQPIQADVSSLYNTQEPQLAVPQGGYQGVMANGGYVGSLPKHQTVGETGRHYGQNLVKQVGKPSLLKADLFPNASSNEGVTTGIDWGAYEAAKQQMQDMLRSEVNTPSTIDRAGGIGQSLGAYGMIQTPYGVLPLADVVGSGGAYQTPISGANAAATSEEAAAAIEAAAAAGDTPGSGGTGGGPKKDTKGGGKDDKGTGTTDGKGSEGSKGKGKRKGNVEVKSDKTGDKGSTYGTSGTTGTYNTYGSGYAPRYGGGRFKIKGKNLVDPRTGKVVRKIKYDTRQSPRDYYGGRGPRVVKYDIYNNPIYMQAPGTQRTTQRTTPTQSSDVEATPREWTSPDMGGQPGTFSRSVSDYDGPIPTADQSDAYNEARAARLAELARVAQDKKDYAFYSGAKQNEARRRDQGYDAMQDLRRDVGPTEGYAYGGQPFGEQQSYFYANGGGYDPNNPYGMLPQAQFGFSQESTDAMPNQGFGSNQPDMFGRNTNQSFGGKGIDYGDPTAKAKWKGDGSALNDWSPMILPAVDMISSIAMQDEARAAKKQLADMKYSDANVTAETGRNRGTFNQYGQISPDSLSYPQYEGYNTGEIGGVATTKYGGSPYPMQQYAGGGERYITEEEAQYIMAMGGQIEYI